MHTESLPRATRRRFRRAARRLARLPTGQVRDCLRASLRDRARRANAAARDRTARRLRAMLALTEMPADAREGMVAIIEAACRRIRPRSVYSTGRA